MLRNDYKNLQNYFFPENYKNLQYNYNFLDRLQNFTKLQPSGNITKIKTLVVSG